LSQLLELIGFVETLHPLLAGGGIVWRRLTGATDAASGASHNFNEVVMHLARLNLGNKIFGIFQTVYYGELQFCSGDLHFGFLKACKTPCLLEIYSSDYFAGNNLRCASKRSVCYADAAAEDYTCSRRQAESHIQGFHIEIGEIDSGFFNH